jgi:hypothetical protein
VGSVVLVFSALPRVYRARFVALELFQTVHKIRPACRAPLVFLANRGRALARHAVLAHSALLKARQRARPVVLASTCRFLVVSSAKTVLRALTPRYMEALHAKSVPLAHTRTLLGKQPASLLALGGAIFRIQVCVNYALQGDLLHLLTLALWVLRSLPVLLMRPA